MSDLITISNEIRKKIHELESYEAKIKSYAENKAEKSALYEKALSITIINLRNGKSYELDGNVIEAPPTTIVEKIARGICWQEKLEADKAESLYKALVTNMNAVQSILNGYQSLFRHLDKS